MRPREAMGARFVARPFTPQVRPGNLRQESWFCPDAGHAPGVRRLPAAKLSIPALAIRHSLSGADKLISGAKPVYGE